MLKYSVANAKTRGLYRVPELMKYLGKNRFVYSLDLLSGWTCPFAEQCKSKVVELSTGKRKIKDGPKTEFRCFSASQEVLYPPVYDNRKHNTGVIQSEDTAAGMAKLIRFSLPNNAGIIRIHVGGDFFNEEYFLAWCIVAKLCPDRLFYAYTKSLDYWIDNRRKIPSNLVLTASYGGRLDDKIKRHNLRSATVVLSEEQAGSLPIDHDDSHAANPSTGDFALLIHGIQPKGTEASKAAYQLNRRQKKGTYSR